MFSGVPGPTFDCGKYSMRLFHRGEWKTITIDDKLPLRKNNNIIFAQCSNRNEIVSTLILFLLTITLFV